MAPNLPNHIDCHRAAAAHERVSGEIEAPRFTRMTGLFSLKRPVAVTLEFAFSAEKQVCITGHIHGVAEAQCQRCLESARIPIASNLTHEVDEEYCVQNADGAKMFDLLAFIEDEFILACPMTAMHPSGECVPPGEPELIAGTKRNPFDVLTRLRQNTE